MATIQDIKTKLLNANALGRTNLANKGVELPETATTYDIMTAIAEIVSGGGGVTYTNIVYNEDNTITLTDKDGIVHTMECEYTDGKLTSVKYDGKAVELVYDGDVLVGVGRTDIKLNSTEPSKLQVDNPIATTELTGYEAAKAFDGNVATRWATTANQHRGGIGAEFETPCKIAYAKCIKSEYDWKNLTLQCSDDGINWVNASEEIAEPIYDIHSSTTIQSIESGSHKWWRVYSSSCETVAEIEFYGFAVSKQYQNGFALGMASGGVVESEGVKLNIAYGETAPEDTSKLWIKANEPTNVSVGSDFENVESIAAIGNLPTSNANMGCARVGNKIYLFGGEGSSNLNTINLFDIETNGITTLTTKLPSVCKNMGCAAVGNKVYLFGGDNGSSYLKTINVFDTATETISTLPTTLPTACYSMACASVGTKIYLFGGIGSGFQNTINVFDTETETVTTLSTTLPIACYGMGCASVGTKIYLFGGTTRSSGNLNTINVFDTETETISTLPTTLPTACYKIDCAAVGNKIYLFGGNGSSGFDVSILNTINVFDTETETVTTLSTTLPTACYGMGCSNYGNKVYLFGGRNNSLILNTINCLTLTHELTQGNIEIQSGLLKNKFNLINTENAQIKIGVENVYIGNANNEAEPVSAYLYNGTEWQQIS